MKSLQQTINEAAFKTKNRSKDFKIGDKILYTFKEEKRGNKLQKIKGEIVDHFGDGLFVMLDEPLKWFDYVNHKANQGTYNYQEWQRKQDTKSFGLDDDDDSDWGNLDCLSKL